MTQNQLWIVYPSLKKQIVQENQPVYFCCREVAPCVVIELWSNVCINKTWHGRALTKRGKEHQLMLLPPPGDYEYTFRFKETMDLDWSWYGDYNQNFQLSITTCSQVPSVPNTLCVVAEEHHNEVDLWHFKTQHSSTCSFLCVGPFNPQSFVSSIKKGPCWLTPVVSLEKDQEWHMVLSREETGRLWLYMIVGNEGWMSPDIHDSHTIRFYSPSTGGELIMATMHNTTMDIGSFVQTAVQYQLRLNGKETQGRKNKKKDDGILLNKLGYCTWDAFGKSVSAEKLDLALTSLKKSEVPVNYIMLDDGWQTVNKQQEMVTMEANVDKFPGGLKHTVSNIKLNYPWIKSIGVWHALWGYWNGVGENLSKKYGSYSIDKIGLLHDPNEFYQDFYKFLYECKIDFVKVDNQGGFQNIFSNDKKVWNHYLQSMMNGVNTFFSGQVYHSMACTPYLLFQNPIFSQNAIFRNSDDFFPHEKESHTWHIYANAINALWTRHLVGDWDMFQSLHPFAEYHASSRAISGGPVYITDEPDMHDVALLYKLVGQTRHHGYTLMRCHQPPQPTLDTVFGNPMQHGSLLHLWNLNGEYRVQGFWNTSDRDQLGIVTADDIHHDTSVAYTVSGIDKGHVSLLVQKEYNFFSVYVKGLSSCLVSLSPVEKGKDFSVACLGLIDKFNGTKAISKTRHEDNGEYQVWLTHRGCCGFWLDRQPKSVKVDDQKVEVCWNEVNGLLTVDMTIVSLHVTKEDLFYISIV